MSVYVIRVGSTLPLIQRNQTHRFTPPCCFAKWHADAIITTKRGVIAISYISVVSHRRVLTVTYVLP